MGDTLMHELVCGRMQACSPPRRVAIHPQQPMPRIDLPLWLPSASRHLQRLGFARALLIMCGVVWAVSVAISQLIITMMGDGNRWVAAVSTSVCALLITGTVGGLTLRVTMCLNEAHRSMSRFASLDALTGHFNRRHFMDLAEKAWASCKRYQLSCSILLIDLDHFSRVNEQYGHLCGDQVLQDVAEACAKSLRSADLLARYGGEEFIVLLPHTDPLGALDAADRLRERVAGLGLQWQGTEVPISISVGVASLRPEHGGLDHLIQEAEDALYAAKAAGRNCVRAAGEWRLRHEA